MKTFLIQFAAKAVPCLMLILVVIQLCYKLYSVRSRFNTTVNCWFCNNNTRVPYGERNSWTCPSCEQYNGFNRDGDYNRDILSQRVNSSRSDTNSSVDNSSGAKSVHCANAYYGNSGQPPPQDNGLCAQCNEAQRLKIEKLAQFEPRFESRFDQELKLYQDKLEQKYRLCSTCERHVNKVLHEKKKMVLGSKFLYFIMKGAALLKQPHYESLARAQQMRRLKRYKLWMKLLTLVNIVCLLCTLPTASLEQFTLMLGSTLGRPVYLAYTHALTMLHVVLGYIGELLLGQPFTSKLWMFASIMGKMLIYTVGMDQTQAAQATFGSCYTTVYPYAMLIISLISNIISGFKLTRYTALLVVWSVYAKGSFLFLEAIDGVTFVLLGSLMTLILLNLRQGSCVEQLSAGESFHRLCADECINDDETISLLSQQLSNASNVSNSNMSMNGSNCASPQLGNNSHVHGHGRGNGNVNVNDNGNILNKPLVAPSVLSLDSLRLSSQRTTINPMMASPVPAPAASYRSQTPMYSANSLDQQAWRNNYAMNMNMDAIWQRAGSNYPAAGLEPRQPTYGFGMDQRPLTRSTNNLLYPSRLQMQQRHGDISAWVNAASVHPQPDLFQEPNTANLMPCGYNREFSRTSSQSSGFESQMGNNNPNAQRQEQPVQQQPLWGQSDQTSLRDYGPPLRVMPAPASPYVGHFTQEYRPGDLLRKWMDRDGVAKPN
ncbi:uncharacterized protein LOC111603158 [Drosophila hydei]|uniref:Uncharacterized protein LOC111603158 n=1 Tax=Drosophila hydei TaxID=7224 RepID=A0A6J1MC47_DROHY|nr:uncharacterized protein LOC111603158 [Drosophila hydei]